MIEAWDPLIVFEYQRMLTLGGPPYIFFVEYRSVPNVKYLNVIDQSEDKAD